MCTILHGLTTKWPWKLRRACPRHRRWLGLGTRKCRLAREGTILPHQRGIYSERWETIALTAKGEKPTAFWHRCAPGHFVAHVPICCQKRGALRVNQAWRLVAVLPDSRLKKLDKYLCYYNWWKPKCFYKMEFHHLTNMTKLPIRSTFTLELVFTLESDGLSLYWHHCLKCSLHSDRQCWSHVPIQ